MKFHSFICFCLLSVSAAIADDPTWNQWRGPSRDGVWPGKLPQDLSSLKLAWQIALEPSYSGPVTDGKFVFTTETVDERLERVTALDLQTGNVQWTTQWDGAIRVPGYAMANGSWIKATPAVAENALVVLGMRDELVCLDPDSGNIRWQVDLAKRNGSRRPPFGGVCSPLIDQGAVYVMAGGATMKLSLADGSTIWKTLDDEGSEDDALSSPVIETLAGKRQLIVQTRTRLCGADLSTGDVLWSKQIPAYRNMNVLTPTVIGDRVYTAAQRGRSQCFKIKANENGFTSDELWSQKTQAYMSSPVATDDTIFVHSSQERLRALDAGSGKVLWTGRPAGKYQSLVRNGDVILALSDTGELLSIEPSREKLTVIDRKQIAEDSWAYLGVFEGGLMVRDLDVLKVFRFE